MRVARAVRTRSAVPVVPVAVLPLASFAALLRLDRERCDGARLEALNADFLAGFQAIAVAAVLDALQRLIDLANEFALPVARAQLQAEFLFLRRPIVRIREIRGLILHVGDGAIHLFHEIALPAHEDLAEVLELLLAHVRFAALRNVRLYVAWACEEAARFAAVDLLGVGRCDHGADTGGLRRGYGRCRLKRGWAARRGGMGIGVLSQRRRLGGYRL